MSRRYSGILPVGLLIVVGCGASFGAAGTVGEGLTKEELERAKNHAPDLVSAAEDELASANRASEAGDDEGSDHHRTYARLIMSAAVAEADRIEVAEVRAQTERELLTVESSLAGDAQRTTQLEQEITRLEAQVVAARTVREMRALAAEDEARRYRARESEQARLRTEAATIVARQSELLLVAIELLAGERAESLDVPAKMSEVQAVLSEARRAAVPQESLGLAQRAYAMAQALAGRVRSALADAPSLDETRSLMNAAVRAGFAAELQDDAVILKFDSTTLAPRDRARLQGLLSAHPFGPVQVVVAATSRGTAMSTSRRWARALGGDRVNGEALPLPSGHATRVEVRFVAYGRHRAPSGHSAVVTSD